MPQEQAIEKKELEIPTTINALIEALVFAAKEPLSLSQIRAIYQIDEADCSKRQIESETIKQIISDLNKGYEKAEKPYRIVEIAGGYQFATLPIYAEWLGRLYREQGRRKLSQSGIETLAIIAYKQPITKTEIENIRGVNCDYVLKTLLEKELITVTGRAVTVGRPLLYGTTKEFLKHFGLNSITDLPRPREIEEILGESQYEIERRMLEAQAAAEKLKQEEENFKSRLPHIPKKKPELEQKEVEILKRQKTKQIKILSVDEQKILEQKGQEKIEFIQNASDVKEEILGEEIVNDSAVSEIIVDRNEDKEKQIDEIENEIEKEEILTVSQIDLSTNEEIAAPIEDTDNSKIETNLNATKPKRWQVWKEKISHFIKKLFA